MPSVYRILFLAAHAISMALFCAPPLLSVKSLAKPIAMPMQLLDHRGVPAPRMSKPKALKTKLLSHNATNHAHPGVTYRSPTMTLSNRTAAGDHAVSTTPRDVNINGLLQNVDILNNYYDRAQGNAQNLKTYSSQASANSGNTQFARQCAFELTDFQTNILGFQTVLGQLGAAKGLANYDRTDGLETLLKNVVNLNKNVLSYTTELVFAIPTLGPILGPIVYEIKCLLDEILDATENLTDGLLNALAPLLRPLIGSFLDAACADGIDIVGLCL